MIKDFLDHKIELRDHEEALVDELMALVDFGQAINEPTVQLAAERCLRIILKREDDGSG